jgi:nicotinate phosphoribosyltransferase
VAKKSTDKISIGGRKFALRRLTDGVAEAEVIGIGQPPTGDSDDRPVLTQLVDRGEIVGEEPLSASRERHFRSRAELPIDALKMSRGEPVIETVYLDHGRSAANPYRSASPYHSEKGSRS